MFMAIFDFESTERISEYLEWPIAITGGTGFIGRNLISYLHRLGFKSITAISRNSPEPSTLPLGVEHRSVDICKAGDVLSALSDASIVLHLAGNSNAGRAEKDPLWDIAMNVGGTINVIDACGKIGIKRLVFSSSMAVYSSLRSGILTEDDPVQPDTCYGINKRACELHVLRAQERNGLEGVILRYFKVYGPGHTGALTRMLNQIAAHGNVKIYGNGEQTLDYVHTEDIAQATVSAAFSPNAAGRIFNIASGKSYPLRSIIEQMIQVAGRDDIAITYEREPTKRYEPVQYTASIEAAKKILNYSPRWDLPKGLQSIVSSSA